WFVKAEKANCLNERAAYEYGALHYYEKKDVENALKYLYLAADDGNELAYGELGIIFYDEKGDVDAAEKWFKKAEKEGDLLATTAQSYGSLLYHERGNIEKALKFLYDAANEGFDLAYSDIGEILYKEKKDIEGAKKWFKKAEDAERLWSKEAYGFGMFLIEEMGEKELGEHYLKVSSELKS
ncbi:MAG: sel1 repeat family protein, partial [Proteobacteria bacterium]|nr:sel1 repeat family protein [Pseudomonadota bacterium]